MKVDPGRYLPELPYVPAFYRDELLYSYQARYHRHIGATSYSDTAWDLFGRDTVKASMALPTGLDALAARIHPDGSIDGEWLARNTTLYNYYSAFSDPAIATRALTAQCAGNAQASVLLGVSAFWIEQPRALRFCSACLDEMIAKEGECWWRRSHQLPAVLVCSDHGCVLQESRVHFARNGMNALIAASHGTCPMDAPLLATDITADQRVFLFELARRSAELLYDPRLPMMPEERRQRYIGLLFGAGLMKSGRMTDVKEFASAANAFFGGRIGLVVDRLETAVGVEQWCADLLRIGRTARHPMLHLLLEWMIEWLNPVDPFGLGPWPCLNPVGGHFQEPRIKSVQRARRRLGGVIGRFECDCGYSYTVAVDGDGRAMKPRLRAYGPTLDIALPSLFSENLNQAEISRRLGLHPKAVAAAAHRIGLPVNWIRPEGGRLGSSDSYAPRKRKVPGRVAHPKPRRKPGPRLDWDAIDRALVPNIEMAVRAILERRPWKRVTEMAIEREMGRVGVISARRAKLPMARAKVSELGETREAFLWRRLHVAVEELKRQGVTLKPWVVLRRARVRNEHIPVIEDYLNGLR